MAMQKVEFQYITGLKRAIFRNPPLARQLGRQWPIFGGLDGISDAGGSRGRWVPDL